jgi:bacteriocin-like protein
MNENKTTDLVELNAEELATVSGGHKGAVGNQAGGATGKGGSRRGSGGGRRAGW